MEKNNNLRETIARIMEENGTENTIIMLVEEMLKDIKKKIKPTSLEDFQSLQKLEHSLDQIIVSALKIKYSKIKSDE